MTKKILIVANTTWNIFNFRLNLIEKLLHEGYEVGVIAPVDEYIEYRERYPQVKHYGLIYLNRNSKNPFMDILLTLELIRKYKRLKPDLIIHFTNKPNIYGAFAAKIANSKSIAIVTGLGYAFIHNGLVQKITTLLYKLSANFHEKIIFENIEDKELFIQLGIIDNSKAATVKGCGVNTAFFQPILNNKIEPKKIIFTFIGRLLYDKGIREFVAAAKILKSLNTNTEFWIVGELDTQNPATINKDDLLSWIDDEIIVYHGFLRDVRPSIAKSDCIVLPSYREGNPRTITEGMAMGKAVIATNIGGCRENIEEGINGYLVDVKDSQALMEAMLKFTNLTTEQKIAFGEAGRKKALLEFDDALIANEIYKIMFPYLGI
jgi:glycosyltransferase involved in cell wall biosynthesis